MDLYISSLLLGAAGLGVMALSGLGHRGHGDGGHGAHVGHSHGGPSHAGGHAHGSAHTHGARGASHSHSVAGKAFWTLTSPRVLFSLALGFGVSGMLADPFLGGITQLAVAALGGVAFERIVVTPLWNVLMRFASNPATTLESSVLDEATAVTSFDANGQGIVSIEVDGQIVQILATLKPDDRLLGGARVRAGQRVRIDAVDSDKNRCTVSLI